VVRQLDGESLAKIARIGFCRQILAVQTHLDCGGRSAQICEKEYQLEYSQSPESPESQFSTAKEQKIQQC
jgi:hypothetical protein